MIQFALPGAEMEMAVIFRDISMFMRSPGQPQKGIDDFRSDAWEVRMGGALGTGYSPPELLFAGTKLGNGGRFRKY
jgi:hypothetical protein